ncbi:MAG: Ig-like domain-containing protein [Clostridia bacterium]
MVTISIAGRIFSYLTYINVEKIEIIDEDGKSLDTLNLAKGDILLLNVKIYPELANNKKLAYFSLDESIVEIDKDGLLKAVDYGYTEIIVKSLDTDVTDKLAVKVEADQVEDVVITYKNSIVDEISIHLYTSVDLEANVYPLQLPAEKKNVIWTSSDPTAVEVDQNGKIIANKTMAENQYVTITVTTVDGQKSCSCRVTVLKYTLAFKPAITEEHDLKDAYKVNQETINLKDLIMYDSSLINEENILFRITKGKDRASINGDILTFGIANQRVTIEAYVNHNGTVKYPVEFILVLDT